MRVNVRELKGLALDWAVAVSTGEILSIDAIQQDWILVGAGEGNDPHREFLPSTDWSCGGPIMESRPWALPQKAPGHMQHIGNFMARTPGGFEHYGDTPLQASMRAIVAAGMGVAIDIPDELRMVD